MKKILVAASLFAILFGCKDDPEFPNVPQIETVSFTVVDSTAFWKFSFTDGDGDLGSDVDPNYYQELVNLSKDTIYKSPAEIIPSIDIVGRSKGIEGEITKTIELSLLQLNSSVYKQGDTTYFTTYIIDNAGNKSNVIRTPAFRENPSIIF